MSCGPGATITAATIAHYDYAAFTGQATADDGPPEPLQLLPASQRLSAPVLAQRLQDRSQLGPKSSDATILDVRPAEQFVIGHLAGACRLRHVFRRFPFRTCGGRLLDCFGWCSLLRNVLTVGLRHIAEHSWSISLSYSGRFYMHVA